MPSLRQQVEKDIAAEVRVSALSLKTPQHPRLDSLAPPPPPLDPATHPLVASSLARLSLRDPPPPKAGEGLDTARFALPGPSKGDKASVEEWEQAVRNAGAQLEHQRVRLANLELASQFGANSWKLGNFLVEKELDRVQKAVEKANERVVDVNRRRKGVQVGLCPVRSPAEADARPRRPRPARR